MTSDRNNDVFMRERCPKCGAFPDDPAGECDYCEVDGGDLVPVCYVAVAALLATCPADARIAVRAAVESVIGGKL